jgi:mycothiol synthase
MHDIHTLDRLAPEHLRALTDLAEAARVADGHEPLGEHKFLRLQHGDDLAVALASFDGDALTGYAHTLTYGHDNARRVSCEFVVRPDARGRGLEAALLARAVEHARAQSAARVDVWSYNDHAERARLLNTLGFHAERRLLHLHRHMRETPHADAPPGATLREFIPGADESTLLTLNKRIFAAHPEQGAWTIEDLEARMAQPWFRPDDLLILDVAGIAAGFCWLKVEERGDEGLVGEVYVIGVAPEARGLGGGRYLLSRGLQRLAERRVSVAAIYVDDTNTAAVGLYQACGFHYHHVDVSYSLSLTASRAEIDEAAA